ncbi:MAG: DUF1801 domain-containing protein [Chitinophagaceae bacterium]|jgi:hypothetical protein|nr:DUF1801 domain-containing protein [Chitinophagaceae bacterium]
MHPQVNAYIESLENPQRQIAEALRYLILNNIPQVEERYSFKIPFYHYYGMFCYLNAIPGGVELGLCRGKDLVLAFPQLEMGKRVMVAGVKLYDTRDISRLDIVPLLLGAAAWQEEAFKARKTFLRQGSRK